MKAGQAERAGSGAHACRPALDGDGATASQLVAASSAEQPFGDGELSAVTAITAPANLAEGFRVLRPGGRFVYIDELIPDPRKPSSERTAGSPWKWTEVDTRRVIEGAGLTDLAVRYMNIWRLADNRIVGCRKPVASRPSTAIDVDSQREPVAGAASA